MIITILRIVPSPEKLAEVLKAIRTLLEPIRVKPGCLSWHICQDIDDNNAITFIGEWSSRGDLDEHIRSKEYKIVLSLMEMSIEPPKVSFNFVSESKGLELVEEIRRA